MNLQEAKSLFQSDRGRLASKGIHLGPVSMYAFDELKRDFTLAFDAQSPLVTDPNSSIPAILTTSIDPEVIRVLFAPLAFGEIVGERQAGSWVDDTRMFPIVEQTGEVSSYGDFNNNGRAGVNMNWPQFQSYLFQVTESYGERELERAALAKINYVSELDMSAAYQLSQFQNFSYAFGISGLQNYGALNNPYLSAAITPSTKAAGGTTWFVSGLPNATANEVYNDIVALVQRVISANNGNVDLKSKMTLAMSPGSEVALTFTNTFGVNVSDLIKKNYPNMTVKTAPQYGALTAANSQGFSAAGNFIQLIVEAVQGQKVAYAAYPEKMRAHQIVPEMSAWKQKKSAGTWGVIMRYPLGIASMLGI